VGGGATFKFSRFLATCAQLNAFFPSHRILQKTQIKSRPQVRGTAQLAAGVHLLPSGGVFKSAAVEVLRREQRFMATGEICKLALKWGLLQCSGKTPEATMASSLYGDIKRNDGASLFFRPTGGMFGLKEWREQGFFPPSLEAIPSPAAQQEIHASHTYQKGKRQRKNASASKPSSASKRHHPTAPRPPSPSAAKVETDAKKSRMHGILQNNYEGTRIPIHPAQALQKSWQQNENTERSNSHRVESTRRATLSEKGPRERLVNTENSESPGIQLEDIFSLPNSAVTVPTHTAAQGEDWFRAALTEQENKVAAVENKWGPLHPRAGQAYLLLYKACKEQRFKSVESRAQTALTR